MKSIWILERWIPIKEKIESIKSLIMSVKCGESFINNQNGVITTDEFMSDLQNALDDCKLDEYRGIKGYWEGSQGKTNYNVFCEECLGTISYFNKQHKENPEVSNKFRVLKASLIDENVNFWMGNYSDGVENEKVMKYLYYRASFH